MLLKTCRLSVVAVLALLLVPSLSLAQGTLADYQRAMTLRDRYENLAVNVPDQARWVANTQKLWYRKSVKGGHEFVLVDAGTRTKEPAFDHGKLAAALSAALGRTITPHELPFNQFTFVEGLSAIEFQVTGGQGQQGPPQPPWRCTLADYKCAREERAGRGGRGGRGGGGGLTGPVRPPSDINGAEPQKSPDGKYEALINNYNVAIRETGKREVTLLSTDGSEGGYYDPESLAWSPDSKKIAVYKVKPGHRRFVHYVESSPEDQLQPKYSTMQYAKPGDVLDVETPVLFHLDTRKQLVVNNALFPNAYDMTRLDWRKDSSAVTFEYNQRGHQLYRVISIDAATAAARVLIAEEPKTFFCYSGKKFRNDLGDGAEIVWMSERDGWNHLFLYDGKTGAVKNQITKGNWVVRSVVQVDEKARQVYFSASGMYPGKDPYFVHYYRVNLDGTGLTTFTEADANHNVVFSSDSKYYIDTYSRIDLAPVLELRTTGDAKAHELERGDIVRARESRMEGAGSVRGERPRRQHRHPRRHRAADEFRSRQKVRGHREHLRRSAGLVRAEIVPHIQRPAGDRDAGDRRDRLHRRPDRRHGHQQPVEGLSRRCMEEHQGRRLPGPHPLAQSGGGEVSLLRHHSRGAVRHIGRRPERARRPPVLPGLL